MSRNTASSGAGKGDTPRPVDSQKFGANYDAINWGTKADKRESKPRRETAVSCSSENQEKRAQ